MPGSARAESTRERMINVALELFRERGYSGTSIRDIAEHLGITKAAVYYHFPSKESLLKEVLAPATTRVAALLAEASPATSRAERQRLVTGLVDVVGDVGPQVAVLLSDPAVGAQMTDGSAGDALPLRVAQVLAGPPVGDPRRDSAARLRAACAVACLPAGVQAWQREHPEQRVIDPATRAELVRTVLDVLAGDRP